MPCLHRFSSGLVGRYAGWVLVALMTLAITGLPLPAIKKTGHSEPFPCQDCPCGCLTAAQCWDKCCCHSDTEKLAWANTHQGTPPAFLVVRVALVQSQLLKHPPLQRTLSPSVQSAVQLAASRKRCRSRTLKLCKSKNEVTSLALMRSQSVAGCNAFGLSCQRSCWDNCVPVICDLNQC